MEGKKRTILVILIAVVIVVAVFSSFGLNLFAPHTAEIRLPQITEPLPSGGGSEGDITEPNSYIRVEVTPDTVQNVIRTMTPLRPESYYRSITVRTALGDGTMGTTVNQIWADFGWTRVESTWPNGVVEHTIAGDGRVYRWYNKDRTWKEWDAEGRDIDAAQRIPTYEDVLDLNKRSIIAANYEERGGQPCVYVETAPNEAGNTEHYWVSVTNGLLVASETRNGDEIVMDMSSQPVEIPVQPGTAFLLPDATVVHKAAG